MGHTPGPWIVDDRFPNCVRDARGTVVANTDNANQYDNARLIAAAPELLAALEWAVPHIGVGYSGIQRESVMKQVRAAIAKARGDEKSSAAANYQEQARLAKGEDRS